MKHTYRKLKRKQTIHTLEILNSQRGIMIKFYDEIPWAASRLLNLLVKIARDNTSIFPSLIMKIQSG